VYVFAWNFSVTRPTVLTETERRARPNMLSLPPSLPFENTNGQKPALHYTFTIGIQNSNGYKDVKYDSGFKSIFGFQFHEDF
jgi:hypothetical protein